MPTGRCTSRRARAGVLAPLGTEGNQAQSREVGGLVCALGARHGTSPSMSPRAQVYSVEKCARPIEFARSKDKIKAKPALSRGPKKKKKGKSGTKDVNGVDLLGSIVLTSWGSFNKTP